MVVGVVVCAGGQAATHCRAGPRVTVKPSSSRMQRGVLEGFYKSINLTGKCEEMRGEGPPPSQP